MESVGGYDGSILYSSPYNQARVTDMLVLKHPVVD